LFHFVSNFVQFPRVSVLLLLIACGEKLSKIGFKIIQNYSKLYLFNFVSNSVQFPRVSVLLLFNRLRREIIHIWFQNFTIWLGG